MTGHSYVGSTPSMALAQGHPALKTIVPSAGLAAMYHHEFQDGVPYFLQWAGPLFAYEMLAMNRYLPEELEPDLEPGPNCRKPDRRQRGRRPHAVRLRMAELRRRYRRGVH